MRADSTEMSGGSAVEFVVTSPLQTPQRAIVVPHLAEGALGGPSEKHRDSCLSHCGAA